MRNSHAIWDHTVSPATRQRFESHLYPQPNQVLDLATPEGCKAALTYAVFVLHSNPIAGESALDRLACGLGGKTMLPHITTNIPPMLQNGLLLLHLMFIFTVAEVSR